MVALPNLTVIDVEYGHHLDWLQGFRGATLKRLEEAHFNSESEQIGDFLGAFESVATAAPAQNALSSLKLHTSCSWNPNHSALLSFKQLKVLEIEFSCDGGCSSRVNDDIIITLAQAMPKLEVQLGRAPCQTAGGITANALADLACRCPHFSRLRVHFNVTSLIDSDAGASPSRSLYRREPLVRLTDCALSDLEVRETRLLAGSVLNIALTLLQNFPHISNVEYINDEWESVVECIEEFWEDRPFARR